MVGCVAWTCSTVHRTTAGARGKTCRKKLSTVPAIVPLGRCLGWMCRGREGEGGEWITAGVVCDVMCVCVCVCARVYAYVYV